MSTDGLSTDVCPGFWGLQPSLSQAPASARWEGAFRQGREAALGDSGRLPAGLIHSLVSNIEVEPSLGRKWRQVCPSSPFPALALHTLRGDRALQGHFPFAHESCSRQHWAQQLWCGETGTELSRGLCRFLRNQLKKKKKERKGKKKKRNKKRERKKKRNKVGEERKNNKGKPQEAESSGLESPAVTEGHHHAAPTRTKLEGSAEV